MKYYGDLNYNRLEMVDIYSMSEINDPNSMVGYLNKQGLLFDYVVNRDKPQTMNEEGKPVDPTVFYEDCSSYKRKKYKKEYYYIGKRKYSFGKEGYVFFKQLPRIANDKVFKWKENLKYGTKETVIIQGNFEFTCIVKADGDAVVDVRYTKCDNRHRNRVTIARIEVYNAANEEILKAIDQWKEMFMNEMNDTKSTRRDLRLVS